MEVKFVLGGGELKNVTSLSLAESLNYRFFKHVYSYNEFHILHTILNVLVVYILLHSWNSFL